MQIWVKPGATSYLTHAYLPCEVIKGFVGIPWGGFPGSSGWGAESPYSFEVKHRNHFFSVLRNVVLFMVMFLLINYSSC